MRNFLRNTVLIFLLFFSSSYSLKNEKAAGRELNVCDAVKKIEKIFTDKEIKKLLEAKIISEDQTQWSSKVKIDGYKEEYIYDDDEDSYFEAVLDKKFTSVDALETELDYIAASLKGCLKVESNYVDEEKYTLYFFIVGDVRISVASKRIYKDDRSVILRIEYN